MTKYYCSQKFNWSQISFFDGRATNCCKAEEDHIPLNQLKSHPIGFYNYAKIQQDRQDMLDGLAPAGCDHCWQLENLGVPSRRQEMQTHTVTHTTIDDCVPEFLNIVLGNTCAMTCSYCCKKFSHSWRADILKNGAYDLHDPDPRFRVEPRDELLYRLSQSDLSQSEYYHVIRSQVAAIAHQIKTVMITGGEPLISANLIDVLDIFRGHATKIIISSGLGVSAAMLDRVLDHLDLSQIQIQISAENIGALHEFNRFGSRWSLFEQHLERLTTKGVEFNFCCTLSNTSIHGFIDFVKHRSDHMSTAYLNVLRDPGFLAPNVIDDDSRLRICQDLDQHNLSSLMPYINISCDELQRRDAAVYIQEFARRRGLDLAVLPHSFRAWLQGGAT